MTLENKDNLQHYYSAWNIKSWFSTSNKRSRASTFLTALILILMAGIPILGIVIVIPWLLVFAQRFRNMGYSGWWTLITIIPFVSLFPLLYKSKGEAESSKWQIIWTRIWIFLFPLIFIVLGVLGFVAEMSI